MNITSHEDICIYTIHNHIYIYVYIYDYVSCNPSYIFKIPGKIVKKLKIC